MKPMTIIAICVLCAASIYPAVATPDTQSVDAVVMLPAYVIPPEYLPPTHGPVAPPPEPDAFDHLVTFISSDTTDHHAYVIDEYMCMDFSMSLANNLTIAGYDAGIVMINQKNKPGHALVWVTMPEPYNLFYIEPMLDEIYNPDVYTNRADDYTFRETSIDHAERCNNDMRRWGV